MNTRWFIACSVLAAAVLLDSILPSVAQVGEPPIEKAQESEPGDQEPVNVKGVYPHMTVMAPGVGTRSEAGIGALIPWADRLWAIGYVAHKRGQGIGLYEIGQDMSFRKHPASVTGTFANRLVHWESNQVFIGPYAIDERGNVRTIQALTKHRLAATMRHLFLPHRKVYFLTMEGLMFEVDVKTLKAKELFNLRLKLRIPLSAQPHFKSAHTAQGRVVVASNTYEGPEFKGKRHAGRLAEWNGLRWKIIEKNPFVEISGKQNPLAGFRFGNTLYALGWDRASVILRVLHRGEWSRYRLPFGSHSWDHTWNTEWMRIREVQTERYLMDAFGIFYDLPALVYDGKVWGIKPVSSHLRIVPDFCYWRGLLVLAGDQTDNAVGQPQSGMWFGNIDELWNKGKPAGWGGVWWDEPVEAGEFSDPFLMTGFDEKVMHIKHDSNEEVEFEIQVDFLGNGSWETYKTIQVPAGAYIHHEFPDHFSAHWVRIRVMSPCNATVYFHYS
jgi:hypothetical protein